MLSRNTFQVSAELYYKQIKNMADFKGGTRLIMNEHVEKDIISVMGKAYGLELLMKKEAGRIQWSAGYTYSRTFLKSTGKFSDEIINRGTWFPANFDKPNDLTFTFNFLFSRRFSMSSSYIWSTGRPITYPVSSYYLGDVLVVQYSDRNVQDPVIT